MNAQHHIRWHATPTLRSPILIAAFAGWNDAAQVATFASTSLLRFWDGQHVADIDAEEFFDFSETRPLISLTPSGERSIEWPANGFFAAHIDSMDHDVLILVGTEPQLRWRTFCGALIEVAQRFDASCLITLGGLLAEVPHTITPQVSGFATTPTLLPRLRNLGVDTSTYEGPTGIVGTLHDAWQATDLPAISLWGSVPHYISATPNPQVSLALLQRLAALLGIVLPLGSLEEEASNFRARVDEALAENPEASEYVRELEEQHAGDVPPPPAPDLIRQLEEFLRERRPDDLLGE
jgi:proteasome assembly chaperone (PAC2) family protein